MPIPPDPLLSQVDIRTPAEFLERVQSPASRIKDPEVIRFCARRLLSTSGHSWGLRSSAICALGYRIAEGLDPSDPDLPRFWQAVGALMAEAGTRTPDVRWMTSVTMAAVYVAILQENAGEAIRFLRMTLSYRPHPPELSLLHTNFSRCNTMLALVELARGRRDAAVDLLEDVGEVFRTGARSSNIDNGKRGRFQYSEIHAVVTALRLATQIRRDAKQAEGGDGLMAVALAHPIESMSNLVRALEQAGHWRGVLEGVRDLALTGAAPDAPAALPVRRVTPRRIAPPAMAEVPALLTRAGAGGADAAEAFTLAALALAAPPSMRRPRATWRSAARRRCSGS